ncbi:MAG: B12-binding domain-containing radical SAM protein [Candidatus Omnitrophota bacterium]
MRILLINPWIHDFAAYDLWSKPLGLLTIAAHLKKLGCSIGYIDCLDRFHPRLKKFLTGKLPRTSVYGSGNYFTQAINKPLVFASIPRTYKRYGMPIEVFEELLKEEPRPDVILVSSAMTYWYGGVVEAIALAKKSFKGVPVLLGGIYAQLCPIHARDHSGADFVYNGKSITEVIKLISQYTNTALHLLASDTRGLFPLYELYAELPYVTLRTSSGCPFRCSYCGWYLLEDVIRQTEPERVVRHIARYHNRHGIKNFAFYDDALLYRAENHLIKILKHLIKQKISVYFHTPNGLHVRYITEEIAMLMKKSGFVKPRLGLETVSGARQRQTGAKTTNKEFLRAVTFLKKAGFSSKDIAVNIMIGLPGQDAKEIKDSIAFCAKENLRICLEEYSPVPGTKDFLKSGLTDRSDPLLHNNSAFPLYRAADYHTFQDIKNMVHMLNQ